MRVLALLAFGVLVSCGQADHLNSSTGPSPSQLPTASASPTPATSASPSTAPDSPTPTPSITPSASPTPSPTAQPPSVQCLPGATPASIVEVGSFSGTFVYNVSDPLHPVVVCRISNTTAHIVTGTSLEYLLPQPDQTTTVQVHSLGTNSENVNSRFAAPLWSPYLSVSWRPNPTVLAYSADQADPSGLSTTGVWLADANTSTRVYKYSVPGLDSFGRPGLPPPTLSVSPDGAYLVAGWPIGQPLHVFRLSDRADVSPAMPQGLRFGVWARTGHVLYLVGDSGVEVWSPEAGPAAVPNTIAWTLTPDFSPDGSQVVFTAVTSSGIRIFVYDFKVRASRLLIDKPRSAAMFVKPGWVWYLEEKACVPSASNACFDPTQPDGNVLAMNLATGQESPVTFAPGDTPVLGDWASLEPSDVWPLG